MNITLASRSDYLASRLINLELCKFIRVRWLTAPEQLEGLKGERIFFVFWSWKIPEDIIANNTCVSFHASDLPKGRGGSPIQNQILCGNKETKITAFKTTAEMDAGDIYMKERLPLNGELTHIMIRIADIIPRMIISILLTNPKPKPQKGKPYYFMRRTPEESEIHPMGMEAKQVYDLVRCLNMEPYPPAFLRCADGKKVYIIKAELRD